MLAKREGARVGCHAADDPTGPSTRGERERDVDLAVGGKCFGVRAVDERSIARDAVRPLIDLRERSADVVPVAVCDVAHVDERTVPLLGNNRQRRHGARRKAFVDAAAMRGVVERGAEARVLEHHQHALAFTLEANALVVSVCTAVEPDGVGAESGGKAHPEECVRGAAWQLRVELPLLGVEIEGNESVAAVEAGRFGGDAGCRRRWRGRRRLSEQDGWKKQHGKDTCHGAANRHTQSERRFLLLKFNDRSCRVKSHSANEPPAHSPLDPPPFAAPTPDILVRHRA